MNGFVVPLLPLTLAISLRLSARPSLMRPKRGAMKILFGRSALPEARVALHAELPELAKRTIKTLMHSATAYQCETAGTKSRKVERRNRLCVENDLYVIEAV